jgi:membrane fusion protein
VTESSLFRAQAVDAYKEKWHGEIMLVTPVRYQIIGLTFAALACGVIAFAIWGTYTKRVTVTGQLVPVRGVAKVYVQQSGTVIEARVKEGQRVRAGDILFVLSSERQSSTIGDTQAKISRDVRDREQSLHEERANLPTMQAMERRSLEEKIAEFRDELVTLGGQTTNQQGRYELASADYARYQEILPKGYVTRDQVVQRQADLMDQKTRLEELQRDQLTTRRNLADAQFQLESLTIKYAKQMGDVERDLATADQDLSESEARRELTVIAPAMGTATAITAHIGQLVDTSKPLVSIIPDNSRLEAELYASSKAVGFVRPGDSVSMRYQAYPYQKFGQYRGTVTAVADTALSSTELTGTNVFSASNPQQSEPLYQISVRLESEAVTAYGQQRSLHAGMLLEADLMQEKRRLYEWALEPVYALRHPLQVSIPTSQDAGSRR